MIHIYQSVFGHFCCLGVLTCYLDGNLDGNFGDFGRFRLFFREVSVEVSGSFGRFWLFSGSFG